MWKKCKESDISAPLVIDEVNALIRYASEVGAGTKNNIYNDLITSVHEYLDEPDEKKYSKAGAVLKNYSLLNEELSSHKVNGRTLINTSMHTRPIVLIVILTLIFLAFALSGMLMELWFGDVVEPEEGIRRKILGGQR